MSLIGVVQRFRTPGANSDGTYQVTRTAPGAYIGHEYVPGATTTFPIVAVVQPLSASGRENIVIPEGARTEDVRQLWTATELRGSYDAAADPDVIMIPGGLTTPVEPYFVFRVDGPWTMGGRTTYHVFAARRRKP